ncbi:MAG: ABC transporter substrate-binding protein [Nocardiopsis sp. BM-2018]|uniref:ABC-type branched-subunit amino acid transport system substrate-binding protein n=1 Tax=Nocardiopsis metallicus TaxID=179819 RepID=A0A840WDF8_9ACTN|nr:ABC transporter substrate-binding protein [Nocardiopsis metallicus]MBB5494192.1 ABC-type branched-subunit amino acid transport system substrate-binding protein [Nocardiopsis metallicus]QRN79933.1 MAG: ABC transporter substrate-binding protein [Nocardiopsis sp. BM-2018]
MRKRSGTRAALASALALALLATACSGAGEVGEGADVDLDVAPGVTDDTVVIGSHQPLTGPAAPGYMAVSQGAAAVFEYVNAQGGVNGRQIDYRVEDDKYDPSETIDVTRQLVIEDEIFAMVGGLGTPTHSGVLDYLNEEGVPDIFPSSGALAWNNTEEHPLTYGWQTDYTKEAKIQGEYIAENFAGQNVGYLYQNDDIGVDSQAGLDQYLGDEVVARQHYEAEVTDLSSQMAEMENSGAEVIVCSCIPAFVALAMLEAAGMGYEPQWVVSSIGGDTATLQALLSSFTEGTDAEDVPADAFLADTIITSYMPRVEDEDDDWAQFFLAVYDEYGDGGPVTNTHVFGMTQAVMFAQVLKSAGEDLTRQSLIDALETQEWQGPGFTPFASSDGDHGGHEGVYVVQYKSGGDIEMVQEARVTDREGGPIEEVDFERLSPEDLPFHD